MQDNLVGKYLRAMSGSPSSSLTIMFKKGDGLILIDVTDNRVGINPEEW